MIVSLTKGAQTTPTVNNDGDDDDDDEDDDDGCTRMVQRDTVYLDDTIINIWISWEKLKRAEQSHPNGARSGRGSWDAGGANRAAEARPATSKQKPEQISTNSGSETESEGLLPGRKVKNRQGRYRVISP